MTAVRIQIMESETALPRVLIVDDHPLVRRACQQALSVVARVETANGGHEALEHLGRSAFDAVVLDLQMPLLGGMSTLGTIQERFPAMANRVVVMTGALSVAEEARLLELGVSWILKPLSLEALRSVVARAAAGQA